MSAQALLSIIAPVVPRAPQGMAAVDASGFEGLLVSLLGEGEPAPDVAGPAKTPTLNTDVDASTIPGFLIAPLATTVTPAPTLIESSGSETAPADADLASDTLSSSLLSVAGVAPDVAPTASDTTNTPAAAPVAAAAEPLEAMIPPPTVSAPVQPTPAPVVDAAASASSPAPAPSVSHNVAPPTSETAAPGVPTSSDKPAPGAGAVLTAPTVATAPASVTVAPPATIPTPPQPLKPLAERTAKAAGDTTTAVVSNDATKTASLSVASPVEAASPSDQPAKPVEAAAPVARDPGAPAEDRALLSSSEASISQATPQTARDLSLSGLSRATIDATAQIAAQILRKLEGRSTSFEMALTPDDLGRVDVKLDIDSEGRLAARLAFDNPAAATDLRGRADELRRQLEAQGFHLAEDAFEFTQRDSGSHAFDRGQDSRGGHARFSAAARLNAEADAPPAWTAPSLSPSGVDMKV